jgi:hypothetical protein
VRFATGANLFGLHAVCGWVSGTSMGLPGERGSVLIERFPCAAGPTLRFLFDPPGLELHVDAGLAVGAIETRGRGFATTYDAARLELGARVAVDAALHLGRRVAFAPIVGLEATYYPMVYDLDVGHGDALGGPPPVRVAAQTPSVWAGVTAGMCWSME